MRECSVKRGEIVSRQIKARNCLDFNLFKTSFDFFVDQNRFLPDFSKTLSQYLITCFLMAVSKLIFKRILNICFCIHHFLL